MFRSKSGFEKVLDKATSNMLLDPDFDSMLQLCDMIRGGDIKARDAAALMKSRVLEEKNPNVQYFALCVLDTAMKNCGEAIHEETITESFLEEMKSIAKSSTAENVKNKVLEMIQAWGIAFKEKVEFRIATNLYNGMKVEGFKFPPPIDTADMFKAEKAPVWKEGDECSKCKTEFGLVQRKHHCRACGGIFCNRCTSKQSIIPKFGIEKEVRVCDKCYAEINTGANKSGGGKSSDSSDLPAEYLNSALFKESQMPAPRDEQALREEEELQVALALSLDEQENKKLIQKDILNHTQPQQQVIIPKQEVKTSDAELDPELARYLNRSFWENKKDDQTSKPAATTVTTPSSTGQIKNQPVTQEVVKDDDIENPGNIDPPKENGSLQQNGFDEEEEDHEEFLHTLRTSVEIFINRMRSDQMRNRSIANDSSVQSLFQTINQMHPKLLNLMGSLEDERLHYEALQDKLTQIRDARAALDALRQEHEEKMRRAAEEAERMRQIQMAHKLHIMRQKKQEYLAYQRQLALQRMQEQEAARQARLEQHKQFIMQRAMQPPMVVPNYTYAPQMQMNDQNMQDPAFQQHAAAYQQYQVQQPPGGFNQQQQQYNPMTQAPVANQYSMQTAIPTNTGPIPSAQMNVVYADGSTNMQQPHALEQITATAPPPTPQSTPQPQNVSALPPHQDTNVAYTANLQQVAHQQIPQQQVDPIPQTTEQVANLLISFD